MPNQKTNASGEGHMSFFVDHIFRTDPGGKTYTMGGKFPAIGWRSYLAVFRHLTVVSRVKATEDTSTLSISSTPAVDFVASSPHRGVKRLLDLTTNRKIVRDIVQKSDAVVARLPSELGLLACKAAHEQNKPLLIEVVACPWDSLWHHGSWSSRAYALILTIRTKRAVLRAPIVRYVTAAFLQRRYPTKGQTFVASNVELESGLKPVVERPLPCAKKKVVIGTIGSLNTRLKGVHTAIDALKILKLRYPDLNFEYRVLGEGHFNKQHGSQSPDFVRFDGTLPGGKPILDWLDDIEIYLQPSFQEGLPRSLIEALSRGCISIGSTAGGIPELLPDERLHTPGDAKGLADKIDKVLGESQKALRVEAQRNLEIASLYAPDHLTEIRVQSLQALLTLTRKGRTGHANAS